MSCGTCRRWGRRLARAALVAAAVAALATPTSATLSLALVQSPSLGRYFSGSSGRQFVVNTDGSVGGANAGDYLDGAAAGWFTVADDASPASIVILVDNIWTSGGLSVSGATCRYDGGADQTCDGGGMTATSSSSAPLMVGLDVTTTQSHAGGAAASVSYDVTVAYQ